MVADFDAIALDCGYQPFEINGLRNLLKDKGYIHTTDKRNTLIIRLRGKVTRVIGFKDEKMVAGKYYDKLDDKTADSKKQHRGNEREQESTFVCNTILRWQSKDGFFHF